MHKNDCATPGSLPRRRLLHLDLGATLEEYHFPLRNAIRERSSFIRTTTPSFPSSPRTLLSPSL